MRDLDVKALLADAYKHGSGSMAFKTKRDATLVRDALKAAGFIVVYYSLYLGVNKHRVMYWR